MRLSISTYGQHFGLSLVRSPYRLWTPLTRVQWTSLLKCSEAFSFDMVRESRTLSLKTFSSETLFFKRYWFKPFFSKFFPSRRFSSKTLSFQKFALNSLLRPSSSRQSRPRPKFWIQLWFRTLSCCLQLMSITKRFIERPDRSHLCWVRFQFL